MARWFTVLIALVAQGMTLMSPACFVRCVGADGRESLELIGQDCRCCESRSDQVCPQVCAIATCCEHCQEEDVVQDVSVGSQLGEQDCSCRHSPASSAPQLRAKSVGAVSQFDAFAPVPATWDFATVIRSSEVASLQQTLLRPQGSSQLDLLATVILRV